MTHWLITDKGDPDARRLVDGESIGASPHYSRQTPGSRLFTRNGQNLVFMTDDLFAVWVTFRPTPGVAHRSDRLDAWECALFRNEGSIRSSDLIREAVELSISLWGPPPSDGIITFIKPSCVGKGNLFHVVGYCYRRAGWKRWGESSDGKPRFRAPTPKTIRPYQTWKWKGDRGGKLRQRLINEKGDLFA